MGERFVPRETFMPREANSVDVSIWATSFANLLSGMLTH